MPKIIVKIPNIKAKSSAVNMVEYIAKREGVDTSVNNQVIIKAPTIKQMEYINELLKLCPDAKESYEYEDNIENQTRQNASAFINIFAGEVIGTYTTNTKYRIEYTVDTISQTPKHRIRVLNGNTVVASTEKQDMQNLPEEFFDNVVNGFRFVNTVSPDVADGKSKKFEIDNITVERFLN